jgi:sortase A
MVVALGFAIVVAVAAYLDSPMQVAAAKPEKADSTAGPLLRSDPGVEPWVERDIPPPKPEIVPEPEVVPEPETTPEPAADPQPRTAPKPDRRPAPSVSRPERETSAPPARARAANDTRSYRPPPGAIMSLSVPSIGLGNVPVFDSVAKSALDEGVVHLPDTSLPWSKTPERNVYLAGHRLGWPGTGSHLVFYRLDELDGGEKITLRGKDGARYDYAVIDSFVVGPEEGWVTGRVRGRDLVTLQTCTPIPTFEKRLIVRAERI